MNRRNFIFAMTAAALATAVAPALARNADSAAGFLLPVYEREIERHNKRLPPDNAAFVALFTREMRALINAPRKPDPTVTLGPILHALFGHSVLPGSEVTLESVATTRKDPQSPLLTVRLNVRGTARDIGVRLVREDDAWRIDEIDYAPGDTLRVHYERITAK